MLDYSLLEALLAVEREGSFEGAARALGITSSAVSQRIKLLEGRIGAVTITRQSPATPTEFGNSLCRHAEQVMLLEDCVIKRNDQHFTALSRSVRNIKIAVNEASLSSWFVDVLRAQAIAEPALLFEISTADQNQSIEQMKSGRTLAAVSGRKSPVTGFKSAYLGKHIYRATASPAFIKRHFPDGVTLDFLKATPSLRHSNNDDLQRQWIEQQFGESFDPISYILPSSNCFVSACIKDIGWGMNPASLVDPHIASGSLIELVPDGTLEKPLYWHHSQIVSEPLRGLNRSVLSAAREHLLQQPDGRVVRPV